MDKKIIGIEARKYKVNQNYNESVYFLEYLNLTGQFGWYISYYGEKIPEFFAGFFKCPNGFQSIENALTHLEAYLKQHYS